jgi:peptidoglycan/xylan/chitin deacetylase (PgdA/CDA1 family)
MALAALLLLSAAGPAWPQATKDAPAGGPDAAIPGEATVAAPSDTQIDRPRGYYPGDPLPPKTVYLSFDDGPWEFTSGILDILEEEGVRATFFLNSYDKDNSLHPDLQANILLRYADDLRRMVADGDAIGNHSYSHRDFAQLSKGSIAFQLDKLERDLGEALASKGVEAPPLRLVRPPFGSPWLGNWNKEPERMKVKEALAARGFVMLWTTGWDSGDSLDWAPGEWFEKSGRYHPGGSKYENKVEREDERILKRAVDGASGIILMHDTHPTSRDTLKRLIVELKARGYSFATLEDYCRWRWGERAFEGAAAPSAPVPAGDSR